MKVLFFDTTQAYLTPGGKQVHTQNLFRALNDIGVKVEYSRWWDPKQEFDVIHFFGYNAPYLLEHVKNRNKKAVLTQIMDVHTSLSPYLQHIYGAGIRMLKNLPQAINKRYSAVSLGNFDAVVYINQFDKSSAKRIFAIEDEKAHVIPHAYDGIIDRKEDPAISNNTIDALRGLPEKYLVSVGSIIPRKRSNYLAKLARESGVPIVFIGQKNHNEYGEEFLSLVDNKTVFYLGFADQNTKMLAMSKASGFVLLSSAESGCIAVHEAAAMGLPLLLPEANWAKAYPKPKEIDFCNIKSFSSAVTKIQEFYASAEKKPYPSFKIYTWKEIALKYKEVYKKVLDSQEKTTMPVEAIKSYA